MIYVGCDIGSLTGKALILRNDKIISSHIIRAKSNPVACAMAVVGDVLDKAGLVFADISLCCSTGYGRENVPFANINISEISCHGMGAHWIDESIRTVIDIGGQDCKVISIDETGLVNNFIMNDKCAAGTGRSIERLSKTINLDLEQLGDASLKSRNRLTISNKCSIFMELEVLQYLYKKRKTNDIAYGINEAIAKRVAYLARSVDLTPEFAVTGGVAKNVGVVRILEDMMDIKFKPFPIDPQLIGALGAAVLAMNEAKRINLANCH
jgi:(R)-2-hydroxyacyl-CoA dehydratese activating ATPase